MNQKARRLIFFLLALSLVAPVPGWTQDQDEVDRLLNDGYALLERGEYDQAQKLYEDLLKKDATHPLALNNLGVIMGKRGKYDLALGYLRRALPRAKGFKIAIDRVCNIDGVCAACPRSKNQLGSEDLEGVVKSNILMMQLAKPSKTGAK